MTVPSQPTCPRHPDRVAYVRCQRCDRPACPQCQRPAAVGFHCVDCVKEAARQAPTVRNAVGGVATERPRVTFALIGICVAVYLGQRLIPGLTTELDFAPMQGRTEPWRFLTATFLHDEYSAIHILSNMLALWLAGRILEPVLGSLRFLALYLTSAVGGSVMFLLFAQVPQTRFDLPDSLWLQPTVGASGAVFGLFGALLLLSRRLRLSEGWLVMVLIINALLPLRIPNIAWQAHLGGFLAGLAVTAVLVATRARPRHHYQWPAIAAVVVLLIALAVVKYLVSDDSALVLVGV